jgi:hypothetical protein
MESLKPLDEESARECEKAAAVKFQHEADAAGFHAATAKSAALEACCRSSPAWRARYRRRKARIPGARIGSLCTRRC